MLDRLGNELKVGDRCVCFSNMRTGSSTTRLVQYEGIVTGFTNKLVKVKCVNNPYSYQNDTEFKCRLDYVFKMLTEVVND